MTGYYLARQYWSGSEEELYCVVVVQSILYVVCLKVVKQGTVYCQKLTVLATVTTFYYKRGGKKVPHPVVQY